jgi:hypothetical protein
VREIDRYHTVVRFEVAAPRAPRRHLAAPRRLNNHSDARPMSHAVCASVARPAVCAALARAARPVSTTKPARPNLVCTRVAEVETSYDNATIDLTISTDEARVCFQFDKAVLNANEGPVIFVTGVAIGCAAETAGVVPGQRLVALSDPINKGELWFLDGTERLAFVLVRLSQTTRPAFAIAHTRPAKGLLRPEGRIPGGLLPQLFT